MSKELVEDKDVKHGDDVEQTVDGPVLNVFVHSSSGLADAWSDAEMSALLSAWREVMEAGPVKRFDVVRRVLKRLKEGEGGFPRLDKLETKKEAKDDILRQMDALRNEYQAFKTMLKVKTLNVYRHPCVDQLELILDRIPQARRTRNSSVLQGNEGAVSEDSEDPSRQHSVSESEIPQQQQQRAPRGTNNRNQDEVVKPRFQQRRMNLTRLVRVMVTQQQTMLEQLERLFQVLEQSSERMGQLAKLFVVHSSTGKIATEVDASAAEDSG